MDVSLDRPLPVHGREAASEAIHEGRIRLPFLYVHIHDRQLLYVGASWERSCRNRWHRAALLALGDCGISMDSIVWIVGMGPSVWRYEFGLIRQLDPIFNVNGRTAWEDEKRKATHDRPSPSDVLGLAEQVECIRCP